MSRSLHEPSFLILLALVERPLHGYALLTEVETVSGGRVTLRVGTLYAALDRLCGEGAVAVSSEEVVSGRLRRIYCLTPTGRQTLRTETERMATLAATARTRLRGAGLEGPSTVSLGGAQ